MGKGSYGVFDEAMEAALERAIQKAIPVDNEQVGYIGNEPVFLLCQYLKGIDLPKSAGVKGLKPFIGQWYELSKEKLIDEEGCPMTFGQVWAQVVEVWDKVKYSKGNALETAKIRAGKARYEIPELNWCDDEKMLYLARVCYELSRPDGVFFMSGYDAGEILGKDQKTGRAFLKMLQSEGVIRCTKVGNRHKASEYLYIGTPVFHTESTEGQQQKVQKMIEDMMRAKTQRNK
ncbi:MAG: hypothetical protein JXM79_25440 [Sedimentisphaerales bacterium]|nr:hypothetical protein [Sedimentisphaerales bacterium]